MYERQIETAKRLIQEKGEEITYRRVSGDPTDTNKPHRAKNKQNDDTAAYGAFFPFGTVSRKTATLNNGVQNGDMEVLVAGAHLAIAPRAGDLLQRSSDTSVWWKVVSCDSLNVNGEKILHTIHVSTA